MTEYTCDSFRFFNLFPVYFGGKGTGELLGLLNSDIDLERRVLHLERGVKEVWRRDGLQAEPGRDVKVGKLKSATSKRTIPLNDTAIAMIQDLRKKAYFGEDLSLIHI